MSYAAAQALQKALYDMLKNDAQVFAYANHHIYDAMPKGVLPPIYVTFGEEKARDLSTKTSSGAAFDIKIEVHADIAGFDKAKQLAGAICDVLIGQNLALTRGYLFGLNFKSARARKGISPERRLIDLTLRALVSDI